MSINQIHSQQKTILPPTYLLIALITMLALYFIYPVSKFIPIPWNLVGVLLLGSGVWISYAAEAQFHRAKTTVQPFNKPTILVTDGMFRFSRNPMYLGFVIILLGVAILLGSLAPFLVIPFFIVLIDLKFIRVEERNLAQTFDQDWVNYVQKVRRWI
jgi:protein-S-isoprenylcysteine O-methyltransferase Ste14